MNDKDKLSLAESASILRTESRDYYDKYRKHTDGGNFGKARSDFEKYKELNRIAAELDIIVGGL